MAGRAAVAGAGAGFSAVLPAALYVAVCLVLPFLILVDLSFREGGASGFGGPHSLRQYLRLVSTPVYANSLVGSFRLGLTVTAAALVAGYPVAHFLARSRSRLVPLVTAAVVLPLFVSVVVRSFGWMVLLGRQGTLNRVLLATGLADAPVQLLYTEGAVILGLTHILLPLMVLPIAAVLRGIDPMLGEAALSLGASKARAFLTVTLPLSLPGVAAGCLLVLAHVVAAFVLPALIGSDRVKLMATMIFQQVMVAGDVPLGAALAVVMVAATLALLALAQLLTRRLAL